MTSNIGFEVGLGIGLSMPASVSDVFIRAGYTINRRTINKCSNAGETRMMYRWTTEVSAMHSVI